MRQKNDIQEYNEEFLLQAPVNINWNYTYRCQLNCAHCYSREYVHDPELNDTEKEIVANNILRNQVFSVNFGGGECLLDSYLPHIIHKLSQAGVYTSLSTSGWKVESNIWQDLKHLGLDQVVVSLDSPCEVEHDSQRGVNGCFQDALKCIEYSLNAGLYLVISTVITHDNIYTLEDLMELAHSLGCNAINLKRIRIEGNARNQLNQVLTSTDEGYLFESILKWKQRYPDLSIDMSYRYKKTPGIDAGCLCGKKNLTIRCNGDISACAYTPVILGNALKDDIGEVWRNSPVLIKMRGGEKCMGDVV